MSLGLRVIKARLSLWCLEMSFAESPLFNKLSFGFWEASMERLREPNEDPPESRQKVKRCRQHTLTDEKRHDHCLSKKTFTISPISRFNKPFPHFRDPKEIGCFSQDFRRKFKDDSSQLRCYCPPDNYSHVYLNLRHGYEIFIQRDESVKTYINDLLKWILLHKDAFSLHGANPEVGVHSLSTDFISWRGLYTTLLCTPYENRDGWKVSVIKYKDTFYMCEYETTEKIQQKQRTTERQKEMSYWGVKFEQYVTAAPGKQPDTTKPVNNSEAFCSVVRTRLNKHSLVFGAEIDCYETVDDKKMYVELKTSREIDNQRQLSNFKRFKVLKWWAQSFLIGIRKIVCGFRDDDGVVHRLEDFSTLRLAKYCQDIDNCWEANVCFNFLDEFLQYIKDTVVEDNPRVAYVFKWYPGEKINCIQYPPGSEYSFLPDWYIKKI